MPPSFGLGEVGPPGHFASQDIVVLPNGTHDDIEEAVKSFAKRLRTAGENGVGFFYYSGHGGSASRAGKRTNYLLPIKAKVADSEDFSSAGIALQDIVDRLADAKAKAVFVVIDACRSELAISKGSDDPDKGMVSIASRSGIFLAYSTGEGFSAPDDGLFARALATQIAKPGQTHGRGFELAAREIGGRRDDLNKAPYYTSGTLQTDICFVSCSDTAPLVAAITPPVASTLQTAANAGQSFRDCPQCPEMVVIPKGSFTMGSPTSETERDDDEGPRHVVDINYNLAVGKYEITREEYAAFVNATGRPDEATCSGEVALSWRNPGFAQTERNPVVCVTWDDAKAYVSWLSTVTGRVYRLLSEAEWEYAARARTQTARFWGASADSACEYANGLDLTYASAKKKKNDS